LIIDRIGYGTAMIFAFVCHVVSAVLTIFAPSFGVLYLATFIYALANGTVEAVVNPVVATLYKDNKTHWLNILHAGWPGGLILGGFFAIGMGFLSEQGLLGNGLQLWQWKMTVLLLPVIIYGFLLFGQKFPIQERVEAGVFIHEMLEEFGWGSAYIVSFLIIMGISQILTVLGIPPIPLTYALAATLVPAIVFALFVRSFGRPMFVFLMLVMFLLATTELGTDTWIQDIMGTVLNSPTKGTLFLVYTSAIMFVLRFFAGPIVHRISPLGLLAACSAIVAVGLYWLGHAGTGALMLFLAATCYGIGETFFWPTALGTVSEQYPRGGALLLMQLAVATPRIGIVGIVEKMPVRHDYNRVPSIRNNYV
jgi:MFS family permease